MLLFLIFGQRKGNKGRIRVIMAVLRIKFRAPLCLSGPLNLHLFHDLLFRCTRSCQCMYGCSTQSEISLNYTMVSWQKVHIFHYNFVKNRVYYCSAAKVTNQAMCKVLQNYEIVVTIVRWRRKMSGAKFLKWVGLNFPCPSGYFLKFCSMMHARKMFMLKEVKHKFWHIFITLEAAALNNTPNSALRTTML